MTQSIADNRPPATTPDSPTGVAASRRRLAVLHAFILLALVAGLWAPRLRGPVDLRFDAGVYYVLGTSLAEGKGYRLLNEPGEIQAVQYPPLLPAIAAAAQGLSGSTDQAVAGRWLRGFNVAVYAGYVFALYALAKRFVPPTAALVVVLLTGLHHQSVYLSDLLFAEIPFALVCTLLLLFNRRSGRPGGFLATAACGVAAFLLRTAGLAVLVAWVAEAVVRRQWRQVVLRAVVAAVPVLGWQGYVASVTSSPEYASPAYAYQRAPYQYYNVPYAENVRLIDPFAPELGRLSMGATVRRVASNVLRMPTSLGESVSSDRNVWRWMFYLVTSRTGLARVPQRAVVAVITVVGLLPLLGLALMLWRRRWLVALYAGATMGLICLTPWPEQFIRYLAPLVGVLALATVYALVWAGERLSGLITRRGTGAEVADQPEAPAEPGRPWLRFAPLAVVAAVLLATELPIVLQMHRPILSSIVRGRPNGPQGQLFYYDRKWVMYDLACAWLKRNAAPGDVVATASPQWAYLKTGLTSVMPPMEIDPRVARQLMADVPVRFVIVDEIDIGKTISRYAGPAVRHDAGWRLAYEAPDRKTRVYERQRAAPTSEPASSQPAAIR